jgi:hypothetical protein
MADFIAHANAYHPPVINAWTAARQLFFQMIYHVKPNQLARKPAPQGDTTAAKLYSEALNSRSSEQFSTKQSAIEETDRLKLQIAELLAKQQADEIKHQEERDSLANLAKTLAKNKNTKASVEAALNEILNKFPAG